VGCRRGEGRSKGGDGTTGEVKGAKRDRMADSEGCRIADGSNR